MNSAHLILLSSLWQDDFDFKVDNAVVNGQTASVITQMELNEKWNKCYQFDIINLFPL